MSANSNPEIAVVIKVQVQGPMVSGVRCQVSGNNCGFWILDFGILGLIELKTPFPGQEMGFLLFMKVY